ncbi:MAG: molybdate ABC transporter substrate-binding protein [Saprospiraceae bacterium]|nr:molybdate ABC transporter substrate-binding protein [Saprospiraceae bacterium]
MKSQFVRYLAFWLLTCWFFSCGSRSGDRDPRLLVAAAANVQFAMEALETAFERESGIEIEVIVSSSGKLTAQIRQGAPYDLLISADTLYPGVLYREGYALRPPEIYAYGSLVLWSLQDDIALEGDLLFLGREDIEKIALANPLNAPYGKETIRALESKGLLSKLESKLVYGESIAQTNQYILSRACQVGFTAKSVVVSPRVAGVGQWVEVAEELYRPIAQGVVITRSGEEKYPELSRKFYTFLFGESATQIFREFGYDLPSDR